MTKYFLRALLCLFLLLPIGAAADDADDKSFSNIFVFGDSISDIGNAAVAFDAEAFILTGDPRFLTVPDERVALCFPGVTINPDGTVKVTPDFPCDDFFHNSTRVSDGPVAVEVLAKRLEFDQLQPSLHVLELLPGLAAFRPLPFVGTNYAAAGARVVPDPSDLGEVLGGLPNQIDLFLLDLARGFHSNPSDALYVIFIGGNDLRDAGGVLLSVLLGLPSDETSEEIIAKAVDGIEESINALIGAGARKFLVVNSPNFGAFPAIRLAAQEEGIPPVFLIGLATLLTTKFNKQLAERLDQIRAEQIGNPVEIKEFDLFRFFEVVRLVSRLFRLNTVDFCFNSELYRNVGRPASFHPDCGPDKFDRFVFFDDLHLTGRIHSIIGRGLAVAARKLID